jgi:hypothetical protein
MPTNPGVPIGNGAAAPWYVAAAHPFNWMDINADEFAGVQQSAVMRGQPVPLAFWQHRPQLGPQTVPQGTPLWLQSRPYDRGAEAFAPHFGKLNINPIGAGIYAPYRIPTIAGPGARYQFGAIWFDVQSVPTSMQMNPTVPIETVEALLATAHVGPSYLTTG